MVNLSEFYNTLFSIQVALAGVSIAAIIAIAQILQSLLTFRPARKLLTSWQVLLFAGLLLIGLCASGIASLLSSLSTHDYITFWDLNSQQIITSPWFAIVVIILMLISIIYFIYIIYSETRYLIPSRALNFFVKNYDHSLLKKYLSYRYATPPQPPVNISFASILGGEESDVEQEDKSFEERKKQYQKEINKYKKARVDNDGVESPLAPLESYLIKAIQGADVTLLIKALRSFEALQLKYPGDINIIKYYRDVIRNAVELALSQKSGTALEYLLESVQRVCSDIIENDHINDLTPLLDLLKDLGDTFNEESPRSFIQVMSIYRSVGEDLFSAKGDDVQERIDDVIRDVAWLGEKMLASMEELEEVPLMHSGFHETKLSALVNCLFGIGQKFTYTSKGSTKDIRIYLDAMYVVAKKLVESIQPFITDEDERTYEETYFSLMHNHESLFEVAIRTENKRNACLAMVKLKDFLKLAKENDQQKLLDDTVKSMFRIGVLAAPHTEMLGRPEFSTKSSYLEEVISCLVEYGDPEKLAHEAREALVRYSPEVNHRDTVKEFVKTAGQTLGTDFGMNLS